MTNRYNHIAQFITGATGYEVPWRDPIPLRREVRMRPNGTSAWSFSCTDKDLILARPIDVLVQLRSTLAADVAASRVVVTWHTPMLRPDPLRPYAAYHAIVRAASVYDVDRLAWLHLADETGRQDFKPEHWSWEEGIHTATHPQMRQHLQEQMATTALHEMASAKVLPIAGEWQELDPPGLSSLTDLLSLKMLTVPDPLGWFDWERLATWHRQLPPITAMPPCAHPETVTQATTDPGHPARRFAAERSPTVAPGD